jgi:hypothetical protein
MSASSSLLAATMNQKSSVRANPRSVSRALMPDSAVSTSDDGPSRGGVASGGDVSSHGAASSGDVSSRGDGPTRSLQAGPQNGLK